jgi:hypothetical protein
MVSISVQQSLNVAAQQVPRITATTNPATGTVVSTFDTTGQALASPSEPLVVQFSVENDRGDANTVTVTVSDSHGNQSFLGQIVADFAEGDDSTAFLQFDKFPPQADQVTPMDKCDYRLRLVGSSVSYQVFTL